MDFTCLAKPVHTGNRLVLSMDPINGQDRSFQTVNDEHVQLGISGDRLPKAEDSAAPQILGGVVPLHVHVVRHTSHFAFLQDPALFNAALLHFIDAK